MLKITFRICLIISFFRVAAIVRAESSPQSEFKVINAGGQGGAAASVTVPVLSFIIDSSQGLRPVVGIVGSASIGSPLNLGFGVMQAAIPAGPDYILATTNDGSPRLLQVRGGTIMIRSTGFFAESRPTRQSGCSQPGDVALNRRGRSLDCVTTPVAADERISIDRIAVSPSGFGAALFSASQQRIYTFTNLAQAPALLSTTDLGDLGSVSALGISDDGKTIALGVSDGDNGSLFLLNAGQAPRLLAAMRHPSVVTFLHGSNNAVIADDVDNKVYAVSDGQVFTLASADQGIAKPVGIGVSNDNQTIFIGNGQSGSITTVGPSGVAAQPCNCTLTGLYPTNADSVFRVTDFSGGPVLFFDGNGATPRMLFVRVSGSQF